MTTALWLMVVGFFKFHIASIFYCVYKMYTAVVLNIYLMWGIMIKELKDVDTVPKYIVYIKHLAVSTYNHDHYIRIYAELLKYYRYKMRRRLIRFGRLFQLHLHEHIVFTKLYTPLLFCQYLKSIWSIY